MRHENDSIFLFCCRCVGLGVLRLVPDSHPQTRAAHGSTWSDVWIGYPPSYQIGGGLSSMTTILRIVQHVTMKFAARPSVAGCCGASRGLL